MADCDHAYASIGDAQDNAVRQCQKCSEVHPEDTVVSRWPCANCIHINLNVTDNLCVKCGHSQRASVPSAAIAKVLKSVGLKPAELSLKMIGRVEKGTVMGAPPPWVR